MPKLGRSGAGARSTSPPGMCDQRPSLVQLYSMSASMTTSFVFGVAAALGCLRILMHQESPQLCMMYLRMKTDASLMGCSVKKSWPMILNECLGQTV